MLKKLLRYSVIGFLTLGILLTLATILVLRLPQFGVAPSGAYLESLRKSPQHNGEVFENEGKIELEMSSKFGEMINAYMNLPEGMRPDSLPILHPDIEDVAEDTSGEYHLTWFGHSAFLLEVDNKHILLDPALGPSASPFSFQVTRFNPKLPIALEELPEIDAIVFSHDHYDHLDYSTILALKDKVKRYFVPLGLKGHLVHWGVDSNLISELDWWQEAKLDDFSFACTPSQHFSGRSLNDRGATLWCSWVIDTPKKKIFFSGDSGYFKGFKEIGEKYGPFDLALLECGQYNKMWKEIHMMPEETAMAAVDLGAKQMMPIHWGMFELAIHPWKEPAQRVVVKAEELHMPILTPRVGQRLSLVEPTSTEHWWESL